MDRETTIAAGTNRPVQRRCKTHGWTDTRRAKFLDHLAASCNVLASCEAVGMTKPGLYALRNRDPVFAGQFRAALLVGYERLEAELLRKAVALFEGDVASGDGQCDAVVGQITVDQAIKLLDRHHAVLKRDDTARREIPHRATQAETDAMLSARLKALKLRHEAKA